MIQIGSRHVGSGAPAYIIAEAGSNHNGDLAKAYSLIDIAHEAGADCVKFQSVTFDSLSSDHTNSTLRTAVDSITLDKHWYDKLSSYCNQKGIDFMSTPTYERAVDELSDVGVHAFKIASMDLTNIPLLRYVATKGKPIILSRGMSSIYEISYALQSLQEVGFNNVALLHCVAEYPANPSQINLRQITSLSSVFGLPVGLSDHTESVVLPSSAVTLGASIIEKHFTDDRSQPGFDHFYAMDPLMLKTMIKGIRDTEKALGSATITVGDSELINKRNWQRSIVAATDINVGETLTSVNLTTKRPGTGISPLQWDAIVGCRALRPLKANQILTNHDFAQS